MLYRNNSAAGGGTGLSSSTFTTVDSDLSYTAADIGVDLTGKTLRLLYLGGNEWVQGSSASVNAGGGIDFTVNPGANSATFFYE